MDLLRGEYCGGACDDNILNADVRLDCISPDEGLYTLVQTGGCRRRVLTAVYKNKTARMLHSLTLFGQGAQIPQHAVNR